LKGDSALNPLSPFTYTLRHKGRALMLTALLALAVMGLYLLIGLMQESYVIPDYTINLYLSKFSLVQPDLNTLDPAIAAQIRTHPGVAQVLPQNNVEITVPNVGGLGFYFRLLGLQEADVGPVLAQSSVTLIEGQLPQPRTNGVALSQEIAAALGLKIGDTFDWTKDDVKAFARYANIVSPLELVGILSGDVRLGIMSYEYLDSHERYRDLAHYGVLVIAQPGYEEAVDDFLRQTVRSSRTDVYTHKLLEEAAARAQAMLYALFVPIMLLVAAAVTLVVGAINQLAFLRRLPEFGTLHAVGQGKGWLARRLTLETAGLAVAGWALGVLASWGGMAALSAAVYAPKGFPFNPLQVMALILVAPIPLAVIGFTLFAAVRAIGRMDAVAIVERGELSLEKAQPNRARSGRAAHVRAKRLPRPLAATTFFRRHSRRAATLIGAMALMIVGTAGLVFVIETVWDVGQPFLTSLSRTSRVSPKGLSLEATVMAQIRAHPAVERVIPTTTISPLGLAMPLIRDDSPIETYGVTAEDMTYLVELYGLELAEGRLPRPNTSEIVIPWTAAKNRNIQVGDVIGDRDHPIYPDAPRLPSELVVSGVFARVEDPAEDVWLSFMSQEFVNDYRDHWKTDLSLIVVPKAGQKATLDTWLESQIDGEGCSVVTYGKQQAWMQEGMNTGLFTLSLMESIIALVAALALAGLNYIFVTQRQAEFGVLNALGLGRLDLVCRVARESLFTTGAAWLLGLLGCTVILACLQYGLYTPSGLRLDFFNPTPWLFTLPVPVAVLVVSAVAVGWALSRLDPVAIIERR
jgi:ABC-type antimicrobial peptide transport system permease subunit